MVFCSKCGTQNDDSATSCIKCGTMLLNGEAADAIVQTAKSIQKMEAEEAKVLAKEELKKAIAEWVSGILSLVLFLVLIPFMGMIIQADGMAKGEIMSTIVMFAALAGIPAGWVLTTKARRSLNFLHVFIGVGTVIWLMFALGLAMLTGWAACPIFLIKRIVSLVSKKKKNADE